MKNILYIGGFELPDKNAAAQRVLANAMLFRELGYKVNFIGISRESKNSHGYVHKDKDIFGFESFYIKYPTRVTEWLRYLVSTKHITSYSKEVDMIVAYNYPSIALYKLYRWCKRHDKVLIADCTEWYQPNKSLLGGIKRIDTYLRMRIIQPKLSGVIAISKYLFNFYSSRMDHVIQLPPLVDKANEKWDIISTGDFKLKNGIIKLVYAGSPGTGGKDNLQMILTSLSLLKAGNYSFMFNIIGLSLEQYLLNPTNTIPENIKEEVNFLGRVNHIKALSEVANADFQIFFRETNLVNTAGFPTKFVESISCGTAVISNLSSNIGDYLMDGNNGYVLDISNVSNVVDSLSKIFSCKNYPVVQCDLFDYHNYLDCVKEFLIKEIK